MKIEVLIKEDINDLIFPDKVFAPLASPYWVEVDDNVNLSCYFYNVGADITMLIFHGNGETANDYLYTYFDLFKHDLSLIHI